ncbi:MAG TPA: hypothetical protein VIV61_00100 [Candidatus Ozemobacteraceae bacterium]
MLIGCMGGGGGGGGGTAGPSTTLGTISGKVTLQAGLASLHASSTKSLASVQPGDAVVFLEENPSITAVPAADGSFSMTGIPFGSYFLLARLKTAGGVLYKVRSLGPANLTSSTPAAQMNLSIAPADRAEQTARLMVFDPSGTPVSNCTPILWGESFTFQGNGIYLSPLMPLTGAGTIYVNPPPGSGWQQGLLPIPAGTFRDEELVVIGAGFVQAGSTNHPPVVRLSAPFRPAEGLGAVSLAATVVDPENDPFDTAWSSSNGRFAAIASFAATWIAPADAATSTITFKAVEARTTGTPLSGEARLVIHVAPPGSPAVPGEITIFTPRKLAEITGTTTTQISGDTQTEFIASLTWPADVAPAISWSASNGMPTSYAGATFPWRSPALPEGQVAYVDIALVVQDATSRVDRTIRMTVTSIPDVRITTPVANAFEGGSSVTFSGYAADYRSTPIDPASMTWYLATGTQPFRPVSSGSREMTYRFTARGAHQVALEAVDLLGITATATKQVTIVNARPVAVIVSPANQTAFQEFASVQFQGTATDFEDGSITTNSSFGWTSDLDGFLGSGTTLTRSDLTSGSHTVTLAVRDSEGGIGLASVGVRINLPPVLDFVPASNAAYFTGQKIAFIGVGTDTDNSLLPASGFDWFLNGAAGVWKTGVASFVVDDSFFPAGLNTVKLEGTGKVNTVGSVTHRFTIGVARASVTAPASGTRVDPGTPITFTAIPPSTGLIAMQWWEEWGRPGATQIGTNTPQTLTLPIGRHTLTYVGSDSSMPPVVSTGAVSVVVERLPQMAFTPANGAVLFQHPTIPFAGVGTDTNDAPVLGANMSWLRDGVAWMTATASFLATGSDFPGAGQTGQAHTVTLAGTGPYGSVGSVTYTLRTGIALASITRPINGSRIDPVDGLPVTLTAVPNLSGILTMAWYRDYGSPGQTLIGNGPAATDTGPIGQGFHRYTYIGTDSVGVISSSSVTIAFEPVPIMDFTPASGSVFFTGTTIAFRGVGTDTDGISPVPPGRMTWYVDSRGGTPWKTGTDSFTLASGIEPAGTRRITLTGRSMLDTVDGVVFKDITIEYPLATITAPASGTRFDNGAAVNLAGTPQSHASMTMEWWRLGDPAPLGNGSALNNVNLPDGWNIISYIGTDSQGNVSSSSIRLLVRDQPVMEILPASGAVVFSGAPCTLNGSGTEAVTGLPVASATMRWYLGANLLGAGPTYSPAAGDLAAGWNVVTLTGSDSLGAPGSTTSALFYNYPVPAIVSPASGTTFDPTEPVVLTGTPDAAGPVAMEWWLDRGRPGSAMLGTTSTVSTNTVSVGWHYATYIGTDTFGNGRSSEIMILVQDKPIMAITPATGSWLFSGPVTLTGSGTEAGSGAPIDGLTMKWYKDLNHVSVWQTGPVPALASGEISGWHRIELCGADSVAIQGTATVGIHFDVPRALITSPASGTRFDIGQNIPATGVPDTIGSITMRWWVDEGRPGEALLGSGKNLSTTAVPQGWHYLTYVGTDSLGLTSRSEIMVLVQSRPTMEILPASGSWLFAGPLSLIGSGTEASTGAAIDGATMRWYLDGSATLWQSGSTPALASGEVSGWHRLTLGGTDSYGVAATATTGMTFGVPIASISWPASGTWYDSGKTITATGTPNSVGSITMEWWLDYGRAGAQLVGTGNSLSIPAAPLQGWHYLTYIGTDSLARVSSAEIMILVQDRPSIEISVASGGCLFGGNGISIAGVGTEASTLAPLDPANMTWYLDGVFWKTGSPNSVGPTEVATGTHLVGLMGVDSYGIASAATSSIYFGYPVPAISTPASGSQFASGTVIAFAATPPATSAITFDWKDNGVTFSTSDTVNYGPIVGLHTITYGGTDSSGRTLNGTIQVILNNTPTVEMRWGNGNLIQNGDIVFGGHAFTLVGAGTQSTSLPVAPGNLYWYLDGAAPVWKTGATVNIAAGEIASGAHVVLLKGTDDFSAVGSVTRSFYTGYPVASITAPASGTRIDTGVPTTFTAVPDSSGTVIVMNWLWDTIGFGSGQSVTSSAIASGWRTISYVGTDSTGFGSRSEISLFVNRFPVAAVSITSPGQYATAPGMIPIHLASAGTPIQLSVVATDYEMGTVPGTNVTWYWPTIADNRGTGLAKSLNVDTPGTQTAILEIRDNFGSVTMATYTWWVWDAERYSLGLSAPTGIGVNGISDLFVADTGGARIVKLLRDVSDAPSLSGDLTVVKNTAAGILTTSLVNLHVTGDSVFSLENHLGPGTNRVQKFDFNLVSAPATPLVYTYPLGAADDQLNNPYALVTDNVAIYISDSGNNRVIKYDIANNNYVSKNDWDFVTPRVLRRHPVSGLVVSDAASDDASILNTALNYQSSFRNATNAADIAFGAGASPNIYISDRVNNKIIVLDASGNLLYTFGLPGASLGRFAGPWGLAIISNDLYVVENGNDVIHRFRGAGW